VLRKLASAFLVAVLVSGQTAVRERYVAPASSRQGKLASHRAAKYHGARDQRGRIKRSSAAKRAFMRRTGYPHGRPAYVVDHIIPLACGGGDDPSNMQWQTWAEARAKDRVERRECR